MLSKVELEFLKSPDNFDADHEKVLHHRIRAKVQQLESEIRLREANGFKIMKNFNEIMESCNHEISLNQVAVNKQVVRGWDPCSRLLEKRTLRMLDESSNLALTTMTPWTGRSKFPEF
jgi:hypothetical protein